MAQDERKPGTLPDALPNPGESLRERIARIINEPDILDVICGHVANGGTVIQLAKTWDVPASTIYNWIRKDADRSKRYDQSIVDRKEWLVDRLHQEMHALSVSDIRNVYDSSGNLLPIHEWPESVSVAVQSVETQELFEGEGRDKTQVGVTRRVKFWDKNKSLEQLAKLHKLLADSVEHTGQVTLADLILESYKIQDVAAAAQATLETARGELPNVTERTDTSTQLNVTERDRLSSDNQALDRERKD